jgi:hypothetical protein
VDRRGAQLREPVHTGLSATSSDQAEKSERIVAMTQAQEGEPPSWFRPPLFMVGQDRRGNWVVQDQKRTRGGLFVNRDAALRFVRSENGFKAQAVVMVSGGIELDMTRNAAALDRPESTPDLLNRRRIA